MVSDHHHILTQQKLLKYARFGYFGFSWHKFVFVASLYPVNSLVVHLFFVFLPWLLDINLRYFSSGLYFGLLVTDSVKKGKLALTVIFIFV